MPHQAIVSFASLVGNAEAMSNLATLLNGNPDVRGEIYGLDTPLVGMAVDDNGRELGRYIVLEIELPRK